MEPVSTTALVLGGIAIVTKTHKAFLDKIGAAAGILYEPTRIRKEAEAKKDAAIIDAGAKIMTELIEDGSRDNEVLERAKRRLYRKLVNDQMNIDNIASLAFGYLEDEANPSEMNDEWIDDFFDKARKCSDENIQHLWAKVLAGEAKNAGSFSKKTLSILTEIEPEDAKIFANLNHFKCKISFTDPEESEKILGGDIVLVFVEDNPEIYREYGISFNSIQQLESYGLLTYIQGYRFNFTFDDDSYRFVSIKYFHKEIELELKKLGENHILPAGSFRLSLAGEQLLTLCQEKKQVEGFAEFLAEKLEQQVASAKVISNDSI